MSKASWQWLSLAVGLVGFTFGGCAGGAAETHGPATGPTNGETGGDGIPNTVINKTGGDTVSARIGPPGGSLELTAGPRIEIPPGAVSDGEDFVLKLAGKSSAFRNKESEKAVGPIFICAPEVNAPEGRTINVSIPLAAYPQGWGDVAIAYEVSEGEVVGAEDSTRTKWQYERAKLSGGRAVAELSSLTGLRMQFVLTNLEAQ